MAINKKLIHFNEKSEFDKRLANNEILDTSIVFVKDSKEIWTHGNLYKSVNWSVLEQQSTIIEITVDKLKEGIETNNEILTSLTYPISEINSLAVSPVDANIYDENLFLLVIQYDGTWAWIPFAQVSGSIEAGYLTVKNGKLYISESEIDAMKETASEGSRIGFAFYDYSTEQYIGSIQYIN